MKYFRNEQQIMIVMAVILGALLTIGIVLGLDLEARAQLLATQESLAEEVLRFHVLANSDSEEDQTLKLTVKDQVVSYMEEALGNEQSLLETKVWVENNKETIQQLCEEIIKEAGYEYAVEVSLCESYFPLKTYGDITFPEGVYEALKIEIGEAEGENWWCCLYPSLCFIDVACGVVSDEGKENLQEVLTVDEYEMITTTTEFEIKWFFFSW